MQRGSLAAKLIGPKDTALGFRRMIVTGIDADRNVLVKPLGSDTAGWASLAVVQDGNFRVDDEVIVDPVGGGEAVFGRLSRSSGNTVSTVRLGGGNLGPAALTLGAAAGSGASASVAGTDSGFRLQLSTGTGTATGTLISIVFNWPKENANYGVWLSPADSDAAAAGQQVYCNYGTRTINGFDLTTGIVLPTSRSHYWYVAVMEGPA